MKSLRYCDLQTESARQPLYQYRAATIHHRLASMYHSCYRNQVCTRALGVQHVLFSKAHSNRLSLQVGDESIRKQYKTLAEQHYSKAVRLFVNLSDAPCELLRTLLERVAFAEFTMAGKRRAALQKHRRKDTEAETQIGCFAFQVRTATQ